MNLIKKIFCSVAFSTVLAGAASSVGYAAEGHLITMQEADIRAFIDDVSIVTGKTFLIDPRVQGKVTISSQSHLSPREVFDVFNNVMRVHGYVVARTSGGQYRISLLQKAAQSAPLTKGNGVSGQMATAIIKLNHVDAAKAAKLIKPVLHSNGRLTANIGGRILVVTDFAENLRKARAIAKAMDVDGTRMETISLRNIMASDAINALTGIQGKNPSVDVVAIEGNNSLILRGMPQDLFNIKSIINAMDRKGTKTRGAVSVVNLRFASGIDLIETLDKLMPAYTKSGKPAPSIAHDPGSNAIIISADAETQDAIETIIRRLDIRRPQVLVEAIIVEVSETASKDLGVQFALAGKNGNSIPLVSSNFSRSAPNILAITGALASDSTFPPGTRDTLATAAVNSLLGLNGAAVGFGVNGSDGLFSAILTAIEEDKDSNILSTPFVTTLDNVPATFIVGQEIPITTGEVLGTNNANPFRTFDRKPVGIKLDVLPQISQGDVIRLSIKQEVSSIAGALTGGLNDFITNTRAIETTVLANDGEIIVLGGLIQDDEQINISKIPVLGDAPIIGNIFRSKGKSRVRKNLMVFLRPTIIRSANDARPLTEHYLNAMRRHDKNQSGRAISKLDQFIDAP